MIVRLSGLEKGFELEPGFPSVLEIESKTFYTRVCESLLSEEGCYAKEPYTLWDTEGKEIKPRDAFLVIDSPLRLPWDHRLVFGKMFEKVNKVLTEDDESREAFESLGSQLYATVLSSERQMNSSYAFSVEWDLKRCLKAFGYGPDFSSCETLLDNLILFVDFLADVNPNQPLLFLGCKNFLSKPDLDRFYERIFFQKTTAFLLESRFDEATYYREQKRRLDRYLLEC